MPDPHLPNAPSTPPAAAPWPAWLIGLLASTLVMALLLMGWWFLSAGSAKPATAELTGKAVVGVIGGLDSVALAPSEELLKPPAKPPATAAPLPVNQGLPPASVKAAAEAKVAAAPSPALPWVAPPPPSPSPKLESTAPVCIACGWVEWVAVLPTAASVPPGMVTAVAAAQGAQAAQAMQIPVQAGRGKASDPMMGAVAGAMAGALLGPSLERRAPPGPSSVYEIHIRMEDGSLRTFEQAEPVPVGTRVMFQAGQPHWAVPVPPQAAPGGKVYSTY